MNTQITPKRLIGLMVVASMILLPPLVATGQGVSIKGQPDGQPNLQSLVIPGNELHESLDAKQLDSIRHLPRDMRLPENPHQSADNEFVLAVSRASSQGRLNREGIATAFYGIYDDGQTDIGIYGLQAESERAADQREKSLREIWAHNGRFDRSRVHRQGCILVVIWHDGVAKDCWEAINSTVKAKLKGG